jgi:hypothetical protein
MTVSLSAANEAAVNGTAIDASGWAILLGGLFLTAVWLYLLAR